jgi:hypothetical protein
LIRAAGEVSGFAFTADRRAGAGTAVPELLANPEIFKRQFADAPQSYQIDGRWRTGA